MAGNQKPEYVSSGEAETKIEIVTSFLRQLKIFLKPV